METRTLFDEETKERGEVVPPEEKSTDILNNCNKKRENAVPYKSNPRNKFKFITCTYFYNYGYCKFGNNCKYRHFKRDNVKSVVREKCSINKNECINDGNASKYRSDESQNANLVREDIANDNHESSNLTDCCNELSDLNISSSSKIPSKFFSATNRTSKRRYKPLCYYFKRGFCNKGDSCKYYHQNHRSINSVAADESFISSEEGKSCTSFPCDDENSNVIHQDCNVNKSSNIFNRTVNRHDLSSLTTETVSELRSTEISQMKKRFLRFETVKENQTFSVLFQPSDPDWAFDVKTLKLEVDFPEKYPVEKCRISVIHNAENIPTLLIKFLNNSICEWVDKKYEENSASNKAELIFRIFLKWFDKNLEELFITGLRKVKQDLKAKEDGIEFVPVENLFSSSKDKDLDSDVIELIQENKTELDSSPLDEQIPHPENKNIQPSTNQSNRPLYFNGNNGMKIIFMGLELTEGAAAFICTKISISLQCCRCKTSFNIKSLPKKNNSHVCSKCSKNVGFTFDPATIHQFSSVLGTLHLLDCVAVDINLVECHFLVDCLKCSKQVTVDGIHYGQKHKMWCIFCNEKMMISVGSVKFQALKLASVPDAKYLPAKKAEKKLKDPVVKEGEPLPNFGACRHYKKSFRWLRFPCCGRLYPCDECHNEKETDHEMKYASRMICGFCAKEQPYSREKPCLSCAQSMTKKSGSHWEGGKGCRNKIQMSREDKQKYAGVCKTVSKRAQNTKPKKKH